MATPLLITKLHIPSPGPNAVTRPRLLARLDEGAGHRLTLICAPAGFGKTTLASTWIAAAGRPAAWLSLDEADSDLTRFLGYLIAALQTVAPIGGGLPDALQSPQPPPVETVLTVLINEIAARADPLVLVLDDYHAIDARAVDQAVTFLVEHLPPRMHLVITTREDPRLPLARLRSRGQVTELRAADLRFTEEEAADFLYSTMGLTLAAADIAALEDRTEGWIAGLQLAALSMRGRNDIPGFIRAFAGDDRHIVDYLAEEVLQRQPERVRSFLLQTSILDRLSGPLCDAVTGRADGRELLDTLERGNLFVVPLDDKRHWYRYHHLFADVLQMHARAEYPADIASLHLRASAWYERNGQPAEAVRHALAGDDPARAADLVELAATEMRRSRQEVTLLAWLRTLPEAVIRERPVLCAVYAGLLLTNGVTEGALDWLGEAERGLEQPPEAMIVRDHDEFRRLPGAIAVYRAGHALALGEMAAADDLARRALPLIDTDDHLYRGAATAIVGLASWSSGDLEAAYVAFAEGMASLRQAGYVPDVVGGSLALVDLRIGQGRLHDAIGICESALRLAIEHGAPAIRGTADMEVSLADLCRERNELDAAWQHLRRAEEQGEHTGFPQHPFRRRLARARLLAVEGDLDGALGLVEEAERVYVGDLYPNVRPLAAVKARLWVRQGNLDAALGWAHAQGLSATDEPAYPREFEHLTLARILIAHARQEGDLPSLDDALGLLDRLLLAAEGMGRTGSVIEILLLQALVHEARDDLAAALPPLERAMALAEPEGYARIFLEEGQPMARLLADAIAWEIAPAYAARLLAALEPGPPEGALTATAGTAGALAEPLTAREMEVLRLVAEGCSNGEIAEQLYLALDTVKGHNRRIFAKLGVRRRTEALSRARELGLL